MRIERTETADTVRLALDGRLDSSWSESVAAALEEAIRLGRPRIELDMRDTSFVSSVGLGTIVTAFTRFRAVGGTLVIVAATEPVRKMLAVSRLDGLLGLLSTYVDESFEGILRLGFEVPDGQGVGPPPGATNYASFDPRQRASS